MAAEANTKTDTNHCGSCGTSCSTTNASSTSCNGGTCVPICTGTHSACGNPQNGCAINTASDPANCGGWQQRVQHGRDGSRVGECLHEQRLQADLRRAICRL